MDMVKWAVNGDEMVLNVPFTKVNKETRIVSGFATLDNIDYAKDVVTSAASKKAFENARGNLREMHQPIAAGRIVNFREDELFDKETGKFHKGIYVDAYVSKGAPLTWEKVLDKTLTGFSIGGHVNEDETQFVKDADASVRFIKDYDLMELSLVDNPCNKYANIMSFQKDAAGSVIKGMIAEMKVENVFFCQPDGLARVLPDDTASCLQCGEEMKNIGWIESGDDKTEKVREVVQKFIGPEINKGGGEMEPEEKVEKTVAVEETPPAPAAEEEKVEAKEEATVEVEEVKEVDFAKMFGDLKESIEASLSTQSEAIQKSVDEKIDELSTAVDNKTSELAGKVNELSEKFAAVKDSSEDVTKRLGSLEEATAGRKSGEVETPEPEKTVTKGWNGAFLGVNGLV
jgi:hypothetical protein